VFRTAQEATDVDLSAAWLLQQFGGAERSKEVVLRSKVMIDASYVVVRCDRTSKRAHKALKVEAIAGRWTVRERQKPKDLIDDRVQTNITWVARKVACRPA